DVRRAANSVGQVCHEADQARLIAVAIGTGGNIQRPRHGGATATTVSAGGIAGIQARLDSDRQHYQLAAIRGGTKVDRGTVGYYDATKDGSESGHGCLAPRRHRSEREDLVGARAPADADVATVRDDRQTAALDGVLVDRTGRQVAAERGH